MRLNMNNRINLSVNGSSSNNSVVVITSLNTSLLTSSSMSNCTVALQYLFIEPFIYLYLISPLCFFGLILNVINLIVFSDRSFKNLTFKYLRLVAFVDCITCILVFVYCITNYTPPRTLNDKYFRVWYLVHVYFPLANVTAACNVLLTITVTIERLVSVRWPMEKQRLFSSNRVLITLIICFLFPVLANSVNFRAYKVGECNNLDVTPIAKTLEYKYFGICKEILLRFIPICILIFSNCLLLATVRAANQKFKPQKTTTTPPRTITVFLQPLSNGCDTTQVSSCLSDSQSQTDTLLISLSRDSTTSVGGGHRDSTMPSSSLSKMHTRKQQQERLLTIMLVWLSSLYLCGQIPMLFAYPNFVFKDVTRPKYKYYALVVNLVELVTYLANFFIYIRFTTQFRLVFTKKMKHICFCCFKNS